MLLAADIGGTKTLIALFDRGPHRPIATVTREYVTLDFESFEELVDTFIDETGADHIEAVCAGVAGPITGQVARLTNGSWFADIAAVARRVGDCPATLANDLQAMAAAVPVLEPTEIRVLQEGIAAPGGNAAILAAGTGMGQALLHNLNGQFVPVASEGGHADFAARTKREIALVEELSRIYGRVEVERVLSGRGLVNLFRFTHGSQDLRTACAEVGGELDENEIAPAISACALARRCEQCVEALQMFAEAYGAEAGNLGLRCMATAGVYVGGGIAPKILPALEDGRFMDAFLSKDPMVDLLRTLPVRVILNPAAGLLGAAILASQLD
ncbi:MAG: glucokinase [Vicinamibacterales bacterium]